MKRINLAELLKDCPNGMELDCPMYENLYFDRVNEDTAFPILAYTITNSNSNRTIIPFTKYGCYNRHNNAKCVIFPKGKTDWEGFVPPCKFKNGDIIYNRLQKRICICHYSEDDTICVTHCRYNIYHKEFELLANDLVIVKQDYRLATEEEKQKLFKAIKDNGYRWNTETNTLEKLPKFKVGDRIKYIYFDRKVAKVVKIHDKKYELDNGKFLEFQDENAYEISYDKFDINTLKPFDQVLVREDNKKLWRIHFFEHLNNVLKDRFVCMGGYRYHQCVPYVGNEHLLNTNNEPDNFYITW